MANFTIADLEESAHKSNSAKTAEATQILKEGLTFGGSRLRRLEEAISTSDFHTALLDGFKIASVEIMGKATREWETLAVKSTLPDFRSVKVRDFFGGLNLQLVPEGTEYPLGKIAETNFELNADKYGGGYKFTYEMWKNRDFSGLLNIPQMFANAAIEAENKVVFGALLNAKDGGLNTGFFKGSSAGTGALSAATLEAAWKAQSVRKRIDGKSGVDLTDYYLVIHPAMVMDAERLINADKIERQDETGKITTTEMNPFRGRFKILAPQTLADLGMKPKQWFLLPGAKSKNPALGVAFMQGAEQPDMRVQNNQGETLTGGRILFEEGSFSNDTIDYRVRHVVGATTLFDSAAYASTGA